MPLCELCRSIPFSDLPDFPSSLHGGMPSESYVIPFRSQTKLEPFGFPYHPSLKHLQGSSTTCSLCALILTQVELFINEYQDSVANGKYFLRLNNKELPSFNMWITKRGLRDGRAGRFLRHDGDGFWIFTGSEKMHPGPVPEKERSHWSVYLLGSIGFVGTEDDDDLAGMFRGRQVDENTSQETMIERAKKWVQECDEHEHCNSGIRDMPTYLLDLSVSGAVGDESTAPIKLVESANHHSERYIAVSHCWGDTARKPLTTTKSTLSARKAGILFEELPRSFQDTVVMTRALGVRYLWIDSLCICQDNDKEWERESAAMGSVYSHAYLTLAAASAPDSFHGCFAPRKARKHVKVPYKSKDGKEGEVLAFSAKVRNDAVTMWYVEMSDEPLSDRAWCFQERVLSSRTLHFASDQMYFECLEGFRGEDGFSVKGRYDCIHPHANKYNSLRIRNTEEPVMGEWYSMLWGYGTRKLTKGCDKLPALSGLSEIYAERLGDEYVAGLWKKKLIEGMTWQGLSSKVVDVYRAPSWSWAALDGIGATGIAGEYRCLAEVLDYHVEVEGENKFGIVKNGWILLDAPLLQVTLVEPKDPEADADRIMMFKTKNGDPEGVRACFDTIPRVYGTGAEVVRNMEIYVLLLTIGEENSPVNYKKEPIIRGIFDSPVSDGSKIMRRIGWVIDDVPVFGFEEKDISKEKIKLV
ncbi:heterokaryon incompatibility protein-domain-containing protein [Tricladium varicosporioides]|nr:heterokaryon incompatibility protein-domain-containing protein [Hymenoscyphus varicosporioides]